MSKPIVLSYDGGKSYGKTHLLALYAREKVADDMYKSAKSKNEKEFYKQELEDIRTEIGNMSVCE